MGRYGTADGTTRGYLLSAGQFSTIDFPGATRSAAIGINPRGNVVGLYDDADRVTHRFLLTREKLSDWVIERFD